MTLRKKTLVIIGVTFISLIASLYFIPRMVLLSSFAELEKQNTHQNVERAVCALSDTLCSLGTTADDWAAWDDTYTFIEDANAEYIKTNLVDETFITMRLNLMLFINSSGCIVFGKAFDLYNEEEIPVPQSLQKHLSDKEVLWHHPDTEGGIAGVLLLPECPMLVASEPILTSRKEGPIHGALIMGRYLDASEIERLAEITHLPLTIERFNDSQIPHHLQRAKSSLSEEAPILVRPLDAQSIAGYALLEDIYGEPAIILSISMPREIYKQGQATISYLVLPLVVVGLVFGVVTMSLLERQVLSRLIRLSKSVAGISTSGDLSMRVPMGGKDEISKLADTINVMMESLEQSGKALQEKSERLDAQNEELRATEEQLRSAKEELEDRVKERTAELEAANKRLKQTQEQLVRSERLAAIGQLAGGVGHELRNPLGAIKNAAYYVKGKIAKSELGQKEPRVMEFLNIMDDEINTSNKIINDLLGFSRVGKPSVSPTQINNVIEDALSHTTIPENIELIKKLDAELPQVEIDTSQIQQVLVNMISNAVQAMPEGGKLIIGAREKDGFIEVRIADTGCGIPQEAIDKIFDPLFTTKAKGIGLGLAVCKAIIDRHEGKIEVKSQVGKGTTFIIKLPLKRG